MYILYKGYSTSNTFWLEKHLLSSEWFFCENSSTSIFYFFFFKLKKIMINLFCKYFLWVNQLKENYDPFLQNILNLDFRFFLGFV